MNRREFNAMSFALGALALLGQDSHEMYAVTDDSEIKMVSAGRNGSDYLAKYIQPGTDWTEGKMVVYKGVRLVVRGESRYASFSSRVAAWPGDTLKVCYKVTE